MSQFIKKHKRQIALQTMVWPGIIFMIIFSYLPMYGILIAFKNYTVLDTFQTAPWVGLENFKIAFGDPFFWQAIVNTLGISLLNLLFGFITPIILAIMIFEVKDGLFKKSVQTITYLPHFISWVILGGMIVTWLSSTGFVNSILMSTGIISNPVAFLQNPNYYWWIAALSNVWKEIGWGTILYLAGMSSIDPTYYEVARMDGATKLKQIWYITLPMIKGIIALMFVMAVSGLLNSNFDQTMVLQNALNMPRSEVLSSFTYKMGMAEGNFSYATAVGLATSVVSLILLLLSYKVTKKLNDRSIF